MKKIISAFLLVAVFATMLSMTAFAAGANTLTITADKTSVTTGETVVVTVVGSGDWADVAQVSCVINFDSTKFSATTSGRAPWCFDSTWYNTTKDGNIANLGYINTPSVGENPTGVLKVGYISTDGYTIDDGGALYVGGETTVAKINFTALADVETIDSTCFELADICKIEEENAELHTLTLVQIKAEKEFEPETIKGNAITCAGTWTTAKSETDALTHTFQNVAVAKTTLGADVNYSEAGFIWVANGEETANKFVAVDADDEAISGEGSFEYGVVMYNVPADVTITAIPYYITAE